MHISISLDVLKISQNKFVMPIFFLLRHIKKLILQEVFALMTRFLFPFLIHEIALNSILAFLVPHFLVVQC